MSFQLQEDRIIRFMDACERVGIRNPSAFLASKRHMVFDWLKGCFPYGILPTDIDGFVHLNGHFLMLEFKDESVLHSGAIPKGQLRCFQSLSSTRKVTVFVIGLDQKDEPACMMVFWENGSRSALETVNKSGVQDRCRKWSDWVEQKHEL